MRRDRIPGLNKSVGHSLVSARRGTNRHVSGEYLCSCGKTFSGLNRYEKHRADERRAEKKARE